ncbi:hypothetical protein J437_LFUL000783 [Ladona fulva]|uniref:Uncharacterized protein n=1 Tax=Ladona fulva TaxID=123851 RepID=A0A8K0KP84_LADFU|nr:hypothetical protein J437_LFUL000783 [Ladona fulva]
MEFYRMSPESFQFLKNPVSSSLEGDDTHFRKVISPEEKLLITIRNKNYNFWSSQIRVQMDKFIENATLVDVIR